MAHHYHVAEGSPSEFQFWTETRLPFEKTASDRKFAQRLADVRAGLLRLQADTDQILLATLREAASDAGDRRNKFDIENVLFYNIGASAFKAICGRGLCFVRGEGFPAVPKGVEASMNAAYHQHYAVGSIDDAEALLWPANVGELRFLLDRPGSGTKPDWVWAAIHSVKQDSLANLANRPFQLRVHMTYADSERVNIAGFMKPLLDGIISALQYCPNPKGDVVKLLYARLEKKVEPIEITKWLQMADFAVMGRNDRLVVPFGKKGGVQWNPDDHLCHGALITAKHATKGQPLSGSKVDIRVGIAVAGV